MSRPGTSESTTTYVENEQTQRRKLKQEFSIDTKIVSIDNSYVQLDNDTNDL